MPRPFGPRGEKAVYLIPLGNEEKQLYASSLWAPRRNGCMPRPTGPRGETVVCLIPLYPEEKQLSASIVPRGESDVCLVHRVPEEKQLYALSSWTLRRNSCMSCPTGPQGETAVCLVPLGPEEKQLSYTSTQSCLSELTFNFLSILLGKCSKTALRREEEPHL